MAKRPSTELLQAPAKANSVLQAPAKLDLPEPLSIYLQQCGQRFVAGVSTPDERREQLQAARNASIAARVQMGYWLAEIKQAEGQEAFLQAAAESRISQRAAYDLLDLLQLYCRFPDLDAIGAFAALDYTSALACKSLGDEELIRFARGEEVRGMRIDAAVDAGYREIASAFKQNEPKALEMTRLAAENNTLHAKLETAQKNLERLSTATVKRLNTTGLPAFCLTARAEAVAGADQIDLVVEALESLFRQTLVVPPPDVLEGERFAAYAAGTLYHSLQAVSLRLQALLGEVHAHFGEAVTGRALHDHQLRSSEIEESRRNYALIAGRLKVQAQNREAIRENAKGGRGRNRKILPEA